VISLRPFQSAIVDAVREVYKTQKDVLLVSPTGSGKTVMFCYLAQAVTAKGRSVYILVHREELVDQVSKTLIDFGVPHGFIAAGRPITVQPVMVCSVFTLANRVQDYPRPDMVIVDEAHHAAGGSTWARVLGFWSQSYKLRVTATPIRLDGKPIDYQVMVEGPTVAQLIERGDLCRFRMFTPPVVLGKLRMRMGDFVKSDIAAAVDKPSITGDAVSHYKKLANGKRAIVFCISLEHAQHVAEAFQAEGFSAERIDGGMDRAKRKALVRRFSTGNLQVMTSCDLVSEGFDLPAIECAILLRPTASLGLYLQQVGRALRTFPGKEEAIILDHAGNAGRHGLPDDDREWKPEPDVPGKAKKKKPVTSVRTCGECFAASRPGSLNCPYCGFAFPVEARVVPVKGGDLEEIGDDVERRMKVEARREVGMAKGLSGLLALEKSRGYRPGWAMHVHGTRKRA